MTRTSRVAWLGALVLACSGPLGSRAGVEGRANVTFTSKPGVLEIRVGASPFATYVHADEKILRPYFTHLHAPGGLQVSRNHPPVPGQDAVDHDTMHPGLWMAFGDLSGADFWRNRARVAHARFVEAPFAGEGGARFAVENRYLAADGRTVARETCRYTLALRPAGHLLFWDSEFFPVDGELAFGDQEEMGLGARVATPLAVRQGGRITNSDGLRNEAQVWGKQADWCLYEGESGGRRLGVTLMADPSNFRRPWFHARDYGLLVANPFGRRAFTKGEPSLIRVRAGESLRLRFGVLLSSRPAGEPLDPAPAYRDFLGLLQAPQLNAR